MINGKPIEDILEGQGLSQEQVAETMAEISQIDWGAIDPTAPTVKNNDLDLVRKLKNEMDGETDWRKKAKLAAEIISISLE